MVFTRRKGIYCGHVHSIVGTWVNLRTESTLEVAWEYSGGVDIDDPFWILVCPD